MKFFRNVLIQFYRCMLAVSAFSQIASTISPQNIISETTEMVESGPIIWSVNGHTYEAVLAPGLTWGQAQAACQARGGYLATITSAQENDFVKSLFEDNSAFWFVDGFNNALGPWIGGIQTSGSAEPAEGWGWVNGEPFDYADWSSHDPDNCCGVNQNRIQFLRDGNVPPTRWTDVEDFAGFVQGYIFETCDSSIDTDDDALPDCWEEPTQPIPGNGVPLPSGGFYQLKGSDPRHKDVFVEVDALPGMQPLPNALSEVVKAFANAPVSNPDGRQGISLHIPGKSGDASVDDIAGAVLNWKDVWVNFDSFKGDYFGRESERIAQNASEILAAKARAYRYCVFASTYGTDGKGGPGLSSGLARSIPGKDFMVTLGAFQSPNAEDQAGTFMHELGHALGLRHGGGDNTNFKPNYFSVMNHLWQMRVRVQNNDCGGSLKTLEKYRLSWRLDYSRRMLPLLDENDLDEQEGIGGELGFWVPVGPPEGMPVGPPEGMPVFSQIVQMAGPVNWDRIGGATSTDVRADANFVPDCEEQSSPSLGDKLFGWDDWSSLQYAVPENIMSLLKEERVAQELNELTVDLFQDLGALQFDCNANGVPDEEDIVEGRVFDTNNNGIPDECEAALVSLPDQVVLVVPSQNVTIETDSVQFSWRKSQPVVNRYWFEIATDSSMVNVVIDSTLTATDTVEVIYQLLDMQDYWWRVRAGNIAGWGAYSERRRFHVDFPTTIDLNDEIPAEFSLSQNYPNPFNPLTQIRFGLPKASHVRLEIYNVSGQRVATLVDSQKPAGHHIIEFDAGHLTSGQYFYRVTASEFTAIKKLLIIK